MFIADVIIYFADVFFLFVYIGGCKFMTIMLVFTAFALHGLRNHSPIIIVIMNLWTKKTVRGVVYKIRDILIWVQKKIK